MSKTFGFYFVQFSKQSGNVKPFNTAIIGEVDMSSAEYAGLSVEDACRKRLGKELQTQKNGPWERLSDYMVNFAFASTTVNTDKDHQDNKIHTYLREECGYFQHKNSATNRYLEVLDLGTDGVKIFKDAVSAVFGKNAKTRLPFNPRPNQQRFVEAFTQYLAQRGINRKKRRFLMFAVCRLGKTATSLYACKQLKMKKILILSSKCDTANSWRDDYIKWDFMKDYSWCDKTAIKDDPNCLDAKRLVCFLSFQSAARYDEHDDTYDCVSFDEDAWQQDVLAQKWDIVIIDECHFGTDTQRSQSFINQLNRKVLLELSATPFAKINRGEYAFDNSWRYTLMDEYNECGKNEDYVPFHVYHLSMEQMLSTLKLQKLSKKQKQEMLAKCYDSDDDGTPLKWSWDAFFNEYDDPAWLFDKLYENHISKYGKHTMVYVHEKKQGDKLAAGLNVDKYEVLNLCGKNYNGTDVKLSRDIDKSDKPYIIISCGKKFTGTTLKPIENVVFMGQVNSAERFIQFGSRAKNYFEGRNAACNVWDLNPQCFLYSDAFKSLIINEAKQRNTNKKEVIHAYENCMELFELKGLELVKVTDFVSTFEKNIYVCADDEQAPYVEDSVLFGPVFDKLFDSGLLNHLNERILQAKLQISDIPLKKPKDKNRIKGKAGNKQGGNARLAKEKARIALHLAFNRVPTFMKYHALDTVESLLTYEHNDRMLKWNNMPIECIELIKDNLDECDWHDFCAAIEEALSRVPDVSCRGSWKHDYIADPAHVMTACHME